MKRLSAPSFWLGLVFTLTGGSSYFLLTTPVAAFFDPRWPGLALAVSGLLLAAIGWRRHLGKWKGVLPVYLAMLAITGLLVAKAFFGHEETNVRFGHDGVELAGTLFMPGGAGPHPAVILMHGSSPGTRGVFRPFADHFVRQGIATLTYDKRGFGDSGGGLPYTYGELAEDALAGVHYLERQPGIDPSEIGLMGFSEGGWTAPLAASRSDDVAFLIVVSGGALSPAEQEIHEMKTRLEDAGIAPAETARALDIERRLDDYYRTGEGGDELMAVIGRVKDERWFQVAFELSPADVPASLDDVQYTHDPTELDFDALPLLKALDIPTLFIFGGKDELVPPARSANALQETLGQAETSNFRIETFPDADHLILTWPFGHTVPLPRFAPGYLDTVTRWILHRGMSARPVTSPLTAFVRAMEFQEGSNRVPFGEKGWV